MQEKTWGAKRNLFQITRPVKAQKLWQAKEAQLRENGKHRFRCQWRRKNVNVWWWWCGFWSECSRNGDDARGAEEHALRRRLSGGGQRVNPSRRIHPLWRHQGRQDAARSGHAEAPLIRLRHLPRARRRHRRHGQHGRCRALRPRPHRQLRPPRTHQGRWTGLGRPT